MMRIKHTITSSLLVVFSLLLLTINIAIPTSRNIAQQVMIADIGPEFSKELNCLAENIYYESASETFEGKLAVAQVTINRVNSGKFLDTVCGVVKQKNNINGSTVCQFSWVCTSVHTMIRNPYQWQESLIVARKALTEPFVHDILAQRNAMYYHAVYVKPGWKLPVVTKIGNHIFYSERKI
jgi:spore germination cell wall hydrolase CwlJ-like protein